MKIEEIVLDILKEKGMSKAQLGRAVGIAGEKNPSKCISCGICVKACPMDILEIVEK